QPAGRCRRSPLRVRSRAPPFRDQSSRMHANVNTLLRCPLFERTLFYLRHCETEANRLGLITGATDIELNARGREQALAAVALVKALEVDAVYSRPLGVAHSGVFARV